MKHDWYTDEDGEVDIWRVEEGHCNGPECQRCGRSYCHHCRPDCYSEECS